MKTAIDNQLSIMKLKTSLLLVTGLSFPALFFGAPAGSAPEKERKTVELSEMVVAATRYPVPIETIGSSLTVITDTELEDKQIRFVSDALRSVPGLSVSRSGNFGSLTQVRIRGADSNQTLVIIDGVRMNDPASGNEFNFGQLLADDIESIEVLRGPQATLYGSNTIGGVINIKTKQGETGLAANGRAEGGSFATFDGNASIRGGTEQASGAFSIAGLTTDGVNVSRSGDEKDGYENMTINGTGRIALTERLELFGSVRYMTSELQFDDFGGAVDPTTGYIIASDANRISDVTNLSGRGEARLNLFDGTWQQTLGFSGFDSTNRTLSDDFEIFKFDGQRTTLDYQSIVDLDTPSFAESTQTFVFRAERDEEKGENSIAGDLPSITNIGVVGEYRLSMLDSIFITAGLRHDFDSEFEDFTAPRVTAAYLLKETNTRFHSSWGKGVQNPTLTELYGFSGTFIGNSDLEPENSTGWDLGVQQSLLDEKASVDVTYFNNRVQDFISSEFVPALVANRPVNLDGTSKIQGVEMSFIAQLSEGLSFTGAYTYTDGEDPSGEELVRRPPHIASAALNYAFWKNDEKADRANINLNIVYTGEQEDTVFLSPTFQQERTTLDSYLLVNLASSFEILPGVELIGRVENLLDEEYEEIYSLQSPGIGLFFGVRGGIRF